MTEFHGDPFANIRDLDEVTRVPFSPNFTEYVVTGERPPPIRSEYKELQDEVELRYGEFKQQSNDCSEPPDLDLITKCLRSVQASEVQQVRRPSKPRRSEILISKLNPYVQEFVPRSLQANSDHRSSNTPLANAAADNGGAMRTVPEYSNSNAECVSAVRRAGNANSATITNTPMAIESTGADKNNLLKQNTPEGLEYGFINDATKKEKKISEKTASPRAVLDSGDNNGATTPTTSATECSDPELDKMKLIEHLKKQITEVPKHSCYEKRKSRNMAIAALMKASCSPSKPVLLTPGHFLQSPVLHADTNEPPIKEEDLCPGSGDVVGPDVCSQPSANTKSQVLENIANDTTDPYVQESIEKVTDWLEKSVNDSTVPISVDFVEKVIKEDVLASPTGKLQKFASHSTAFAVKPKTPNKKPSEPYQGEVTFQKKNPKINKNSDTMAKVTLSSPSIQSPVNNSNKSQSTSEIATEVSIESPSMSTESPVDNSHECQTECQTPEVATKVSIDTPIQSPVNTVNILPTDESNMYLGSVNLMRSPDPYLGTTMFRRKICPTPETPSVSPLSQNSLPSTQSYVPSEYAEELTKSFSVRKQSEEPLDMATRLEKTLKERDAQIKQGVLENNSGKNQRRKVKYIPISL